MLLHQSNGTLTDFRRKFVVLAHGSIFSKVGASSKPGAIHYGDKHRGICLGFDVPDDCVREVKYVSARVVNALMEKEFAFNGADEDFARELLYTKFQDWAYEQEVRAFVNLEEQDPVSRLYFKPFGEDLVLREVILGPACTLEREQVRALLAGYKGVTVKKARLAFNSFSVVTDHRIEPLTMDWMPRESANREH
ncbi:DUF2971 domain-containing protein [Cupriavidus gilardii]|nr:DUF2971 domain-containing protein [Cupriavidus gilardii]